MSQPSRPSRSLPGADVCVVGAGPAGLTAAIAAAECGAAVCVLEQLDRVGAKLLVTGGGRCNVTANAEPQTVIDCFGRQGRFLAPAIERMGPRELRAWLAALGVATACPDGLRVYPAEGGARSVRDALLNRCRQLRLAIRTGAAVDGLVIDAGRCRGVTVGGEPVPARACILATGGMTWPRLGPTGSGYRLAEQAGHRIVPPLPALSGLRTRETWPAEAAGDAFGALCRIDLPRLPRHRAAGDVLLTHRGVSGPAILDLSGLASAQLVKRPEVPLVLQIQPPREAPGLAGAPPRMLWRNWLDSARTERGRQGLRQALAPLVPRRLAGVLCQQAGVAPDCALNQLPAAGRDSLISLLLEIRLTVTGTEGWDEAMITRGGVALKGVDPNTLASRHVAGLYLAGEMLDLDGPCGGWNLTWAFAAGNLAGASAGGFVRDAKA